MMNTELYLPPACEVLKIDQSAILCASDRIGAETEKFDELGTLELN